MKHDQRCIAQSAKRQTWVQAHPHFCKKCDANGVVTSTENGAPHGEGFWAMEVADDCEHCLGKGTCPRCGNTLFPHDNADGDQFNAWCENQDPCPHCGWNWGNGKADFAPDAECYCWVKDEDELALEYQNEIKIERKYS